MNKLDDETNMIKSLITIFRIIIESTISVSEQPLGLSLLVCACICHYIQPTSSLCSIPGRYESFWKELDYVKHIWKNRQELKVEDAGIAALFGLECFAWFCAGEIVGRGFTFTGYYV